MKPAFEDIVIKKGPQAVLCYKRVVHYFDFNWHYHPEYELTYIINGRGKRLIGDSYENFENGDLVLIGPKLPHTWASDPVLDTGMVEAVVIQFSAEIIYPLLQWQEFEQIGHLLNRSVTGLSFIGDENLVSLLKSLPYSKGGEKMVLFLNILQQLTTYAAKPLSSKIYSIIKDNKTEDRINIVCNYIEGNFTEKIDLQVIADQIFLSVSAFCKFFKRVTGRTFSEYLNSVRIAYACRLLSETDKPIKEIACNAGFDTQAYFNRVFMKQKKITPLKFRNISNKL